jgi:hypothetical protein
LRPRRQRARFLETAEARRALGKEVYPLDEPFLRALERGMPPCGGIALGVDRLVMLACGAENIAEARRSASSPASYFDWNRLVTRDGILMRVEKQAKQISGIGVPVARQKHGPNALECARQAVFPATPLLIRLEKRCRSSVVNALQKRTSAFCFFSHKTCHSHPSPTDCILTVCKPRKKSVL